jgi:hypothetical protein
VFVKDYNFQSASSVLLLKSLGAGFVFFCFCFFGLISFDVS